MKLTQRREEQRALVGEVADAKHAGETFHEKETFFRLFIFQTKKDHGGFFFQASGDTTEELI